MLFRSKSCDCTFLMFRSAEIYGDIVSEASQRGNRIKVIGNMLNHEWNGKVNVQMIVEAVK